ncbi:MAG TPA: hypothetical protein ACFYEK_17960 [Candidatus Wunengus sp. YC60]|uniref:hypothetical protein n=1 Tax=Candidatus Wunengus sp. YC60 TaxID=3367697 RepID=UPI00402915DA
MIQGCKEQKIKEYLHIDRLAEGLGFTKPEEGEELIGVPYGWCDDSSMPFIAHRKGGVTYKTVNCADVSIIVFDV